MLPVYIILSILGLWLGYKAMLMVYHAVKIGMANANALQNEFGTDVLGAARYSLGLPPKKDDHANN